MAVQLGLHSYSCSETMQAELQSACLIIRAKQTHTRPAGTCHGSPRLAVQRLWKSLSARRVHVPLFLMTALQPPPPDQIGRPAQLDQQWLLGPCHISFVLTLIVAQNLLCRPRARKAGLPACLCPYSSPLSHTQERNYNVLVPLVPSSSLTASEIMQAIDHRHSADCLLLQPGIKCSRKSSRPHKKTSCRCEARPQCECLFTQAACSRRQLLQHLFVAGIASQLARCSPAEVSNAQMGPQLLSLPVLNQSGAFVQASKLPKAFDQAWTSIGGGQADLFFPRSFLGLWNVQVHIVAASQCLLWLADTDLLHGKV